MFTEMATKETFSQWIFNSLIENGVIIDYDKTPHVGKGRTPSGNLTMKLDKANILRQSTDSNLSLWGFIGIGLNAGNRELSTRLSNLFKGFATTYCTAHPEENAEKLYEIMVRAVGCAMDEWKTRYVAKPKTEAKSDPVPVVVPVVVAPISEESQGNTEPEPIPETVPAAVETSLAVETDLFEAEEVDSAPETTL